MFPPQYLVPPHILALRPYEPGLNAEQVKEQFGVERIVKLASNENPLGAVAACNSKMPSERWPDMFRYPDGGLALRRKLADRFNLKLENVIAGAGSEGIMANIVRTFLCDDDEVLTTEAAFSGFQVLARGRGVAYRTVPYRNWRYDLPKQWPMRSPNGRNSFTSPTQTIRPAHSLLARNLSIFIPVFPNAS